MVNSEDQWSFMYTYAGLTRFCLGTSAQSGRDLLFRYTRATCFKVCLMTCLLTTAALWLTAINTLLPRKTTE